MKEHFDPAVALNKRASQAERRQAKIDKVGRDLAEYVVRQANEGMLDVEFKAKTRAFLGRAAFIHRNPAVYESANELLAEEGLFITKTGESWHPRPNLFTPPDCDFIKISLTDTTPALETATLT